MMLTKDSEPASIRMMKPYLRLLLLCLSVALSPLICPGQGPLMQWAAKCGGNGHFYEAVLAPSGITWASAQELAESRGGYLATITSAAENKYVYELIRDDPAFWYVTGTESWGPWLGGLQPAGSQEPAGGWTWVTGESFSYQNWAALQPNNNKNENRIQFHGHKAPGGAATWNDLNESDAKYARSYIIEYSVLPDLNAGARDDHSLNFPGTNLHRLATAGQNVLGTNLRGSAAVLPASPGAAPPSLSIALHPGVTIEGTVGSQYGIQSNTDLTNPDGWRGLANVTLTTIKQIWYDPEPALHPQRYYRVLPGPISIP